MIIVTGTIGDHGMAIMARRHQLALEGDLRSDVAPINGLVRRALEVGGDAVSAMKDPTRGGVASTLHEMAQKSGVGVLIDERALPVRPQVRAAAELVGLDPLSSPTRARRSSASGRRPPTPCWRRFARTSLGRDAAIIGTAIDDYVGSVLLDTGFGRRLVAEPEGELLPRIC